MIALDTNVLVRYVVQDHPEQTKIASEFLDRLESKGERCFLPDIVLCELVWVLESCYQQHRQDISEVLEKILKIQIFDFSDRDVLHSVVERYRTGRGDFADYFLAKIAERHGAKTVYTFDKDLKKEKEFTVL